jgi:choice-of-anchor A domain-containing protein
LVVNGNANFPSGAVYPDGTNPQVPEEDIFVGGSFTGEQDLAARVTGCTGSPNCLAGQFAAAQSCYNSFSSALGQNADNVGHYVQWSGLFVNCDDANSEHNYLTLTASELTQFTYSQFTGCSSTAQWVINVIGSDDVVFQGDFVSAFTAPSSRWLWNIRGAGRTITVSTEVAGTILAPNNNLVQTSGAIDGKVIVNNFSSNGQMQVNEYTCYSAPEPSK